MPSDRLGVYRLLASFPVLASYRAKLAAVAIAGTALPAFLLVLTIVLGAGRLSLLAVIALVVIYAALGATFILWATDRLLVPIKLAADAFDDVALERPPARIELPGSDDAAQILRGVSALVGRNAAQAADATRLGERDELTGLWNRRAGRERAQVLIDHDCRRGRVVRAIVADVNGFAAFNARHGTGHGDALLKAIGTRLARLAGPDGVAVRWNGDAFLLLTSALPGELPDVDELLGRPIVVKGSEEPLMLTLGAAETEVKVPVDRLLADAESALAAARGRGS